MRHCLLPCSSLLVWVYAARTRPRSETRRGDGLRSKEEEEEERADLRVFQSIGCRALGCVWFLGGLKDTPQLAPGEHRTVGGSQRTLGRTLTRGRGLTWWTTGPAGVGGGARRYGFFGTSPHFVRTSESLKA